MTIINIQRVGGASLARDGGRVLGNECVSYTSTHTHTHTHHHHHHIYLLHVHSISKLQTK